MSKNAEILLEGTYVYLDKDVSYAQENFKLVKFPDDQTFHIYSEILSRVENGEFLKIMVRWEMNSHYLPHVVQIEKSIGNKYVLETFAIEHQAQKLTYVFQTPQGQQEFSRPYNAKHHLTSPAFATSTLFTLSKKFDPAGRTAVLLVTSNNEWTYDLPPQEKVLFGEFQNREMLDFKLNGTKLAASHLLMHEHDSNEYSNDPPVEFFISKHYGIPYQMIHGDKKIAIKNLKKNF